MRFRVTPQLVWLTGGPIAHDSLSDTYCRRQSASTQHSLWPQRNKQRADSERSRCVLHVFYFICTLFTNYNLISMPCFIREGWVLYPILWLTFNNLDNLSFSLFSISVSKEFLFVSHAQEAGHSQSWGLNPLSCNNTLAYHFRMKIVQQVLLPILFYFQFSEQRHTKPFFVWNIYGR